MGLGPVVTRPVSPWVAARARPASQNVRGACVESTWASKRVAAASPLQKGVTQFLETFLSGLTLCPDLEGRHGAGPQGKGMCAEESQSQDHLVPWERGSCRPQGNQLINELFQSLLVPL